MNKYFYSLIKKSFLAFTVLGISTLSVAYSHQDNDVNVGVNLIGNIAPGVYGRVNINSNQAPPPMIYSQPIIVQKNVVMHREKPIYMYVPEGHYHHWEKNCYRYGACGQNVYFVNPSYIERQVERRERIEDRGEYYRNEHRWGHDRRHHHAHRWNDEDRWGGR